MSGKVELATTAETTTGTDTARAVTPDGLKDGYEGSSNVDTLGTITTGTWTGTAVANAYVADLPTSKITSGTMADARIASSNVTQHEGDIDGVGALTSGTIATGFGSISTGANIATTANGHFGAITSGAVIWQSFPFITSNITSARGFYFRDNDDPEDFRKWDAFDSDMVLTNSNIYGHYVVPEDCTLTHMRGIVANDGSTDNVIINIWYCLQADIETDTTSTTFTKAGSDTNVTIGTSEVGVQINEDYDVDLTTGSIIIPTLKNAGAGGDNFLGSLTLKFITR